MKRIFKILTLTLLISCMMSSCVKFDDFEFEGQVVGYVFCNSTTDMRDLGFIVKVSSPENIGGTITSENGGQMDNVVIIYQADKRLRNLDYITGTMFMSDNYAKANCSIRPTDIDVPQAVFTSVKIVK